MFSLTERFMRQSEGNVKHARKRGIMARSWYQTMTVPHFQPLNAVLANQVFLALQHAQGKAIITQRRVLKIPFLKRSETMATGLKVTTRNILK